MNRTSLWMILIALILINVKLYAQQELTATGPAAEDLKDKVRALDVVNKYKDFLLASKDMDLLTAQFDANDSVKAARAKLDALRKELQDLEAATLKERGLGRNEFYLDFSTGEVKPVPKPTAPAQPALPATKP